MLGEQPEPGLWKVSKGAHTLRIHGNVWRADAMGHDVAVKQVQTVIAASNEVLGPLFSVLACEGRDALYQSQRGNLKRDSAAQGVCTVALAARQVHRRRIRRRRSCYPTAAALLLAAHELIERIGLSYAERRVAQDLCGRGRQRRFPFGGCSMEMGPVTPNRNSSRRSRENAVKYLVETMDRLETDMTQARSSRERVGSRRYGSAANIGGSGCFIRPIVGVQLVAFLARTQFEQLQREAENKLLSALERALNRNETTLVVLPVHLVSRGGGLWSSLAEQRAMGWRSR